MASVGPKGDPIAVPSIWQYNTFLILNSTSSVASLISEIKLLFQQIAFQAT